MPFTRLFACLLLFALPALAQNAVPDATVDTGPQPATPTPVEAVLLAKPFDLEEGYTFNWSGTEPTVRSGTILVLKVDPAMVLPRNALQPVLYAGDSPVQIISEDHFSGTLIGIVPGDIDLAEDLIWFGRPGLPERATPEVIAEERALAERAGIEPVGGDAMESAGAPTVGAGDLASLLREEVADIVREYAPQNSDLADRLQLPVTGAGTAPDRQ